VPIVNRYTPFGVIIISFILDITFFILMQFKDAVGVNFLNLVVYVFINKYLMSRFLCICRHFLLPDLKFNKF
jgi:hypothetical protein